MQGGEKRGLFLDLFELRAVDQLLEPFAGLEQDAHIGDAAGGDRLGLFGAFARNTDTEGAVMVVLEWTPSRPSRSIPLGTPLKGEEKCL